MLSALCISTLVGLSLAAPRPQEISFADVAAAGAPVIVTPALDVVAQTASVAPSAQVASSAAAAIATDPATVGKRSISKRDGTCAAQPKGSGPVPSPDTPEAFSSDPGLHNFAKTASTPDGYSQAFSDLSGSVSASNYMGLYTLDSYDTYTCASKCDQANCQAFNIYLERDFSLDPNANDCPNPPSVTNYKCTLWGAPISSEQAMNTGQWRDSFQIVILGSNGYNKASPPPPVDQFTGPTELGGAINAPLDAQGHNTYMGNKFYPFSQSQGFTPSTCASACLAQTQYNSRHPAADGSYMTCTFFNAYVLSKNGIAQGLYCTLYNQTWDPSYATNYGQYRGSDRYTVSRSYSYFLSRSSNGCPTSAIQNGNFESQQVTPFTVTANPGSSGSVIDDPNGHGYVFSATLASTDGDYNTGSVILKQTLSTCAGRTYAFNIDYRIDQNRQNCYLQIDLISPGYSQGFLELFANGNNGVVIGAWATVTASVTARTDNDVLRIIPFCTNGEGDVIEVDNVGFTLQ